MKYLNCLSIRINYIILLVLFYSLMITLIYFKWESFTSWWLNLFKIITNEKNATLMYFEITYFFLASFYIPFSLLSPIIFLENKYIVGNRIDFSSLRPSNENLKEFSKSFIATRSALLN